MTMLNLFHIPAKGQTFQDMINIFICNYVLRNAILGNSFVTVGKSKNCTPKSLRFINQRIGVNEGFLLFTS